MKAQWLGNGLSLLLHAGLAMVLLHAVDLTPTEIKNLTIDFRLDITQPAALAPAQPAPPTAAPVAPLLKKTVTAPPHSTPPKPKTKRTAKRLQQKTPRPKPMAAAAPKKIQQPEPLPVMAETPLPEEMMTPPTDGEPVDISLSSDTAPEDTATKAPLAMAAATAPDQAAYPPATALSGAETGAPTGPAPSPAAVYLRHHFEGIRNDIQGKVRYPRLAQRMGWEGRVVVSFVVRPDGTVCDTKIVESSGFPALDNNALSTIEEAVPLPRPPVQAELVIPIVFRLS